MRTGLGPTSHRAVGISQRERAGCPGCYAATPASGGAAGSVVVAVTARTGGTGGTRAPAAPAALLTLLTLFALFAKFDRKFRRALPPQGALVAPHSKARMESFPATPLDPSHFY